MKSALARIDSALAAARDAVAGGWSWLPLTLLLGACPGIAAWQLLYPGEIARLADNSLSRIDVAAGCAAVSIVLALAGCVWAARTRRVPLRDACRGFVRRGSILAALPVLVFTRAPDVGSDNPFFAMFASVGVGLIAVGFFYHLGRTGWRPSLPARLARWLPIGVVLVMALAWALAIFRFELIHHQNLGTRDWDLGLYVNTLWNSLHGNPLGCNLVPQLNHAYRHFDPILVLISPILLAHPDAEALIAFQAFWIASGAVPLYLLAKRQLGSAGLGVVLAAVYLLHPALHGPSVYDFHSMMLAGPLLLWAMYALEANRLKLYLASIVLLMLCREDMPILVFLIGIFALISGKPVRVAATTLAAALVYGIAIYVTVVSEAVSYSDYFNGMAFEDRPVTLNIALTLLANPVYLARYALSEPKVTYMLMLVVPLLFLPLLSRRHVVLYLVGLAATLFGTKSRLVTISTQYSVWWLPFMLAAIPTAVDRLAGGRLAGVLALDSGRLRRGLVAGVLFSTIAMSSLYGIFLPNSFFRAGHEEFIRDPSDEMKARYETVLRAKALVPAAASVMATTHLVAHFSARDLIWSMDRRRRGSAPPDFLLILDSDLKRRGREESLLEREKENLKKYRDSGDYTRVLRENGISVYERSGPAS
jgi:uncharacterized membrane protein